MTELYPEESARLDVVAHLEELRWRLIRCLLVMAGCCLFLFIKGDFLFELAKRPLQGLAAELVFIEPAEAFAAYCKVILSASFILSFPYILYEVFFFLAPALSRPHRKAVLGWLIIGLGLFVIGLGFSYFLAIPAALKFLIGFGRQMARPYLTLGHYVSFVTGFLLIGGLIFEIPVVVALLAQVGLVRTDFFRRRRPHVFIAILVLAAVITPTQDVFNMMLFALPMIALFEVGILLGSLIERQKTELIRAKDRK